MSAPHPAVTAAADAAIRGYRDAIASHSRQALAETVMMGADGTPSMLIDTLVEEAIIADVTALGVNVLSEERGWVDVGSAMTLVVDPVDGSANAAAGVPLSCFSAALADDGIFVEAMTSWLHTDERWWASTEHSAYRTSGCRDIGTAAISLLRPHARNEDAWLRVARASSRVRVLGCSTLDAVLVATGSSDGFVDAGSDTHRLMDLAAATVIVTASGGTVADAFGRPIGLDLDLTKRWSGVVAASAQLADSLGELVRGADPAR